LTEIATTVLVLDGAFSGVIGVSAMREMGLGWLFCSPWALRTDVAGLPCEVEELLPREASMERVPSPKLAGGKVRLVGWKVRLAGCGGEVKTRAG
jgi:hypothetical protein